MKEFDIAIAGAGFAGLACAAKTAKHGLSTLVYERKAWPGTHVHTTGIVVKELAENWNIPQRLCKKITGVRLYSPRLNYIDLFSPDYYFLATDTPALMKWHARQAIQHGARIQYGNAISSIKQYSNGYTVNNTQRCRYLIGADGARSKVARETGLGTNSYFLYGLEAEYSNDINIDKTVLHVFIDPDHAAGYIGWIVPGVNEVQVGLACTYPKKPALKSFIKKIKPIVDLSCTPTKAIRAGLIPCGGPVKTYYRDNVLLLGDAAGMVSPVTAGGIQNAIHSGEIAGELLIDYMFHDGPTPGPLMKQYLPNYSYKLLLRHLIDTVPIPAACYELLFRSAPFRLFAQTVFFHNRGLFSTAAWRDFFRLMYEG